MATHEDHDLQAAGPGASTTAAAQRGGRSQVIEFDEFIDAQLRKTRSHVRSVDIATSLMTLAAGTLAFVLVAALVDHWLVTGGLGFWTRAVSGDVRRLGHEFLSVRLLPLRCFAISIRCTPPRRSSAAAPRSRTRWSTSCSFAATAPD